jgi:hypothetical protein
MWVWGLVVAMVRKANSSYTTATPMTELGGGGRGVGELRMGKDLYGGGRRAVARECGRETGGDCHAGEIIVYNSSTTDGADGRGKRTGFTRFGKAGGDDGAEGKAESRGLKVATIMQANSS